MFTISGKVALISGGASGLGLSFAKELLRQGLKGVTLADINSDFGDKALKEIENEFGPNKSIFVQTDVTNIKNFEAAFKETIATFENVDILINNAGVFNDAIWENEIAVNLNGVINGVLLGLENYILNHRSGEEGVIVNVSSVLGLFSHGSVPIYSATKFAVRGLSTAFGAAPHYNRTRIKVLTLCPAGTDTPILRKFDESRSLGPQYFATMPKYPLQKVDSVATGLVKIIQNAKSGTVWISSDDKEPFEYVVAVPSILK